MGKGKIYKVFKVVRVSENTNSFGLFKQFMMAKDGSTFTGCFNSKNIKGVGEEVVAEITLNDDGVITDTYFKGGELIERLMTAPEIVVKEVWKDS